MRDREDHDERSHQRIWELLPWYVNGTLSGQDRERVEDHAAGCRRCQDEVEACRRTAAAVKGLGDVAPSPHPVQLQRVLARIDEAERQGRHERRERREEDAGVRFGAPLRALIAATPRPLRGALLAQVAIIVLLVGVLVWGELHSGARVTGSAPPASYQTLSDPAPAPGRTVALHVMFSPRTTEKEIRELLLAVRGEITAGPSPLGVYTVEVSAADSPVSVVLARLRSESMVTFAAPAAGGNPARGDR
ncbi:MAG TPA: zf-HC2 domain-containing protein [Thermoanaerobaculia bacterium]|nr:zf-HC2 domain-containing protein [Thermoanaerobaculia bacterium]